MIGREEANVQNEQDYEETEMMVCQPEPIKAVPCESVEMEEEQVFLTVSDISVDHFVDSISSEDGIEDAEHDGSSEIEIEHSYKSSYEISGSSVGSEVEEMDGLVVEKGSNGRVFRTKMMTTLKRSLKIFTSCVKPEVDDSHTSNINKSSEDAKLVDEDSDSNSEIALTNLSVDDKEDSSEVDFDDPPGLKRIMTTSVCTATALSTASPPAESSPVTSVAKDAAFCPIEFYRMRVKRFVLTYKNLHETGSILPDVSLQDLGKKCLVLDLDETLIHSQFNLVPNPDLEVPILFEDGHRKPIYVLKRPGVDEFLEFCGKHFEVIIFTASLASYADPVINFLDKTKTIRHRLYRESCLFAEGLYLKDLSRLGRPLDQTILIDNAATSYLLQPENGVAVKSWFSDMDDTELLGRLKPALAELAKTSDVHKWKAEWSHSISD